MHAPKRTRGKETDLRLLQMFQLVLLLSISLKLRKTGLLVSFGHIPDIGEVDRGDETTRLPGLGDLAVQLVDLLERETLGLVDAGVHKDKRDEAEATPDEEHLGLQVGIARAAVDHVRSRVGDGPVEQPVGGGGDGETLGTGLEREQLPSHNPSHRSPGAGEEEDVDADEGDQDFVGHVGRGGSANDGDDKLADAHAKSSKHQQRTTTPLLHHVETGEGGHHVDNVGDESNDEGVADARGLEKGRSVVD